jgi:hypothetical protein
MGLAAGVFSWRVEENEAAISIFYMFGSQERERSLPENIT